MAERKSVKQLQIDEVEQNGKKDEREKAWAETFKTIEKTYGKGSVMRLGDVVDEKVEVIPSGSITLDAAMGVGGYPKGRIIEIFGPESSGKTTLQFITLIVLLAGCAVLENPDTGRLVPYEPVYVIFVNVLIIATLFMTIISGYDYIVKNIGNLKDDSVKKKTKSQK